jgi:hypothetical protein
MFLSQAVHAETRKIVPRIRAGRGAKNPLSSYKSELKEATMRTATHSFRIAKESVASILDRDTAVTIQRWLLRVRQLPALNALPIGEKERTEYLPEMMGSITAQLRAVHALEMTDSPSRAAVAHGQQRYRQGYTAPLIVQESRILQVCIFETIQRNLATLDFTSVLPDVMIIADEVDSQLTQSIDSFLAMQRGEATPAPATI